MKKKILFIHHGSVAGGAPLSMLYTMMGMRDAGYEPLAALAKPSAKLHELYNSNGFESIEVPWVPIWITWSGSEGKRWNPYMWLGIYRPWRDWKSAHLKLRAVLKNENIDIVHLNSVSLSNPASLLMKMNFPFVWHVREHGPKHKGKRYNFLRRKLNEAKNVIFLTRAEQESWLGNNSHGTVVHNFINFTQFDSKKGTAESRKKLGINPDDKVILYVGGKKKHKGIFELLSALGLLKRELPNKFICLMPDSEIKGEGVNHTEKRILHEIKANKLEESCRLMPFNPNIIDMFSACDVLVFPATKPHFARPVIEASAMGKPVIASNLRAIDELVVDGETGYLVPAGDVNELFQKMLMVLNDEALGNKLGAQGIAFTRANFEYRQQMDKIFRVYDSMVSVPITKP
jgi:glycosyltransferase involved in cell wall biosynthesis